MAGVLDGIRVLDLASMWAAPGAAMYLADQGADVIKVEAPRGDDARRLFTQPALGNESPSFLVLNRNKRGMVVNIQKPQGLEVVRALARRADVLLHNFREKVARRYGLSYEDLEPTNPGLVYVQLSAFGKRGPWAERPGYDRQVQALSGMMYRTDANGMPIGAGFAAVDCATPMAIAYGVSLALYGRSRTGRGQKVETSLLQAAIALQAVDLVRPEVEPPAGRAPNTQATLVPYRAADGQWFLPIVVSDKEWLKLCRVLGLPHLVEDPLFATLTARAQHSAELYPLLEAAFQERPREEWIRLLQEADVPCSPIVSRQEVLNHPQVVANDMVAEVRHPTAGRTKMMGHLVRLSANPPATFRPSPVWGQHTTEVLKELGYADETIARLRRDGVVA